MAGLISITYNPLVADVFLNSPKLLTDFLFHFLADVFQTPVQRRVAVVKNIYRPKSKLDSLHQDGIAQFSARP
jgi:hypothetical protein